MLLEWVIGSFHGGNDITLTWKMQGRKGLQSKEEQHKQRHKSIKQHVTFGEILGAQGGWDNT